MRNHARWRETSSAVGILTQETRFNHHALLCILQQEIVYRRGCQDGRSRRKIVFRSDELVKASIGIYDVVLRSEVRISIALRPRRSNQKVNERGEMGSEEKARKKTHLRWWNQHTYRVLILQIHQQPLLPFRDLSIQFIPEYPMHFHDFLGRCKCLIGQLRGPTGSRREVCCRLIEEPSERKGRRLDTDPDQVLACDLQSTIDVLETRERLAVTTLGDEAIHTVFASGRTSPVRTIAPLAYPSIVPAVSSSDLRKSVSRPKKSARGRAGDHTKPGRRRTGDACPIPLPVPSSQLKPSRHLLQNQQVLDEKQLCIRRRGIFVLLGCQVIRSYRERLAAVENCFLRQIVKDRPLRTSAGVSDFLRERAADLNVGVKA